MGKLEEKKKQKVSDCFRHSYLFEKVTFWILYEKKGKVLKLIELNMYIHFAKQSKALTCLFELVLTQIDTRSRLAKRHLAVDGKECRPPIS